MRKSDKNWSCEPEAKQCTVRFLNDGQTSVHTLRVRGYRTARAIIEVVIDHAYEINCALDAEVTFSLGGIEHRVDGGSSIDEVLDAHNRAARARMSNAFPAADSGSCALEARGALALYRIAVIAGNADAAEMHLCHAEMYAVESGRLALHERRAISPFLTADSLLTDNWQLGRGRIDDAERLAGERRRTSGHECRDIAPFLTAGSILTFNWHWGSDNGDDANRQDSTDRSKLHH